MSSIINILLLRLELERKIHEQAKLPDSSQEYSMDEKLQRLKERRQGIQLDTDKGESHDAFVDWVSEPQQANRPLPVWLNLNGLPIAIENQAGTVRNGTDESGHEWSIQLQDHYGEIRDSEGADGDGVDCFVNPDYENFNHDLVFVINQLPREPCRR